jgi:plasmid stability protein
MSKKFNLKLTDKEHAALKGAAKRHNKSMTKMARIYLRAGLASESVDTDLIIRKHNKDTKIVII